ncbi:PTS sugar transporter subunit IIA (plasmid) [Erwinia sp. INIA-01]|uniref:PTS sugar transporter subunit IIA n=1 Tax=Erwinia sp. INIA01 TaxID=2991500 RepID=UPI0022252023|nr:PTS sugar transporter subunit IIA [Erwinia sp. INIA01]MCW1873029.1 PTS sugar transporter subunit IIA [Erwinia sp. INIA01]
MSIASWLNPARVQFVETLADWKESIHAVGAPLLAEGTITPRYIDAIIATKESTGPYFVLAPQIALPHARPEEGAVALGLSVLMINQGVIFNAEENDPVRILFMFSAPDSNSHVEMITELAEVLSDDEMMQKILNSSNHEELTKLLIN